MQATITVDLVEEDVTEVTRINELTVLDHELIPLYEIDDRRGPRRRRSPARDDDVEDIEVRLRGLIIKIGDKVCCSLWWCWWWLSKRLAAHMYDPLDFTRASSEFEQDEEYSRQ